MKANIAIVILIFLALLLGVALLHVQSKAKNEKHQDTVVILKLSNDVVETTGKLDEQKKVNEQLTTNLLVKTEEANLLSTSLVNTSNKLTGELQKTQAEAKAAAEAAAAELAKRDSKIRQLESERDDLDKKMVALNLNINSLSTKISDTERKLTASEGDREFLLKELKRLQTEKSELEKKFTDLVVLRSQVNKLKDELTAARRLDWFRRGLYGDQIKGAELMMRGTSNNPAVSTTKGGTSMNVDVRTDGTVTVTKGATNAPVTIKSTNAPAAKP